MVALTGVMADNEQSFEELTENVKEYIGTRFEILQLEAIDKVSLIGAVGSFGFIISLIAVLVCFFGSLALGFYFAELFDSNSIGFLILSVLYLIIIIVLFVMRKSLFNVKLRNLIIKALMNDEK